MLLIISYQRVNILECVCASILCVILVAVIVEAVVASQSSQRSKADSVGEEDLCAGVYPYL